jgi:hypothetical protein
MSAIVLLLIGIAVAVIATLLTANYRGVMSKVELHAQRFAGSVPWGRGRYEDVAQRLARLRPVMLAPLYVIAVLLLVAAVIDLKRS